jgi:hypothetical protein
MDAEGKITFRGRPITAVKELENDTTNPIWGVNWGELFAMVLERLVDARDAGADQERPAHRQRDARRLQVQLSVP